MKTILVGGEALSVTSDNPADIRAVAADGRTYRLRKRGLTISRYDADCAGRVYSVRRAGGGLLRKRREVTDASGTLVGIITARLSGEIELESAATTETQQADLEFIARGLLLIDAPANNTRY